MEAIPLGSLASSGVGAHLFELFINGSVATARRQLTPQKLQQNLVVLSIRAALRQLFLFLPYSVTVAYFPRRQGYGHV